METVEAMSQYVHELKTLVSDMTETPQTADFLALFNERLSEKIASYYTLEGSNDCVQVNQVPDFRGL